MSRGRLVKALVVLFLFRAAIGIAQEPTAPALDGSIPLREVLDAFGQGRLRPDRIVGGHDTTIEKNPWQVALVAAQVPSNAQAQFCGGSIIAPRWVLTAAHCVDNGTKPVQIAVLSGTKSLKEGGQRSMVSDIIVHQRWNPTSKDSDIALIQVSSDLYGQPITGPSQGAADLANGSVIIVTGWGATTWGGSGKSILQEVPVPYVSRSVCNKPASYNKRINDNMFCAGKVGADSCQGDSGGPATTGDPRRLVGVVSWGEGCALAKKFGVYTRVSGFVDWVKEKTQGAVSW